MSEASVVARSLTYRVRDATLVSNIDFNASPGELIAVIGPNGAGKSTLLRLLSGHLQPTEGHVLLEGVDTALALPGQLALVRSMLAQGERVDLPYTVAQVVEMGRFPHRREESNSARRDAVAISEAMRRTDTSRFADRIYFTLSGGEQTRVSLARVLAQDTPIVFLDEPTTALDVAHQERIMREAVDLSRRDRAVVVVLHDLNTAAVHADTIVLMSLGTVVARGQPRDVLQEEMLSATYGQAMVVVDHPFRDCPLILAADS